jgi:hypothetical protein
LKFFGLSDTIKDVIELSASQFDFLVEHVADFVERQKLSHYLCRDDIGKAINGKVDPEDDDLYKEFLKGMSASSDREQRGQTRGLIEEI